MTYLGLKIFTDDGKERRYFYNMAMEAIMEDKKLELCHHRMHFYREAVADAAKDDSIINVSSTKFVALQFKDINKASQSNMPYKAIDPPKSYSIETENDS